MKIAYLHYMSNRLRAKFHCSQVTKLPAWNDLEGQEEVLLTAVGSRSDDDSSEDNQFSEASPNGKMEMTISNPAAMGFFKPGLEYYLDIETCPRERQSAPERFDKAMAE